MASRKRARSRSTSSELEVLDLRVPVALSRRKSVAQPSHAQVQRSKWERVQKWIEGPGRHGAIALTKARRWAFESQLYGPDTVGFLSREVFSRSGVLVRTDSIRVSAEISERYFTFVATQLAERSSADPARWAARDTDEVYREAKGNFNRMSDMAQAWLDNPPQQSGSSESDRPEDVDHDLEAIDYRIQDSPSASATPRASASQESQDDRQLWTTHGSPAGSDVEMESAEPDPDSSESENEDATESGTYLELSENAKGKLPASLWLRNEKFKDIQALPTPRTTFSPSTAFDLSSRPRVRAPHLVPPSANNPKGSSNLAGHRSDGWEALEVDSEPEPENPFHERSLFDAFGIPPYEPGAEKQMFLLTQFSVRDRTQNATDIIDLDRSWNTPSHPAELHGLAQPWFEALEELDGKYDKASGQRERTPEGYEVPGAVVLTRRDIVDLTVLGPHLVVKSKLATYILHEPCADFRSRRLHSNAAIFANYFLFALSRPDPIWGKPPGLHGTETWTHSESMAVRLQAALKHVRQDRHSAHDPRVLPPYLRLSFEELQASEHLLLQSERQDFLVDMLQRHLPFSQFLTPIVADDLIRQGVAVGANSQLRTDPAFDIGRARERHARDEIEWQRAHDCVARWCDSDTDDPVIEFVGDGIEASHRRVLRLDIGDDLEVRKPRGNIKTFEEARVRVEEREMIYRNGDLVLLVGMRDELTRSSGRLALLSESGTKEHQPWWGRIVYFFEEEKEMKAHVSYLNHSRHDVLGVQGDPRMLFYKDECEDVPACTIVEKANITRLPSGSARPPDVGMYYSFHPDTSSRVTILEDCIPLEEAPFANDSVFANPRPTMPSIPKCICCDRRISENRQKTPTWSATETEAYHPRPFLLWETTYHPGDFVFVVHAGRSRRLARISSIDVRDHEALPVPSSESTLTATVEWVFRRDDIEPSEIRDDRRVVLSGIQAEVNLESLLGAILIDHTEDALKRYACDDYGRPVDDPLVRLDLHAQTENAFHCSERLKDNPSQRRFLEKGYILNPAPNQFTLLPIGPADIPKCSACHDRRDHAEAARRQRRTRELYGHDLYAGGGLFSQGYKEGCAGLMYTLAVETNQDALDVLRRNSSTVMKDLPVSVVAERIWNGTIKLGLDQPDVVLGGPPCQGFSYSNREQQFDDPRRFEVYVFLAYLEATRPAFAVLENVRNILEFDLPGSSARERGGLVISLISILLKLGYQARVCVLQSGAYGVPQSRRRFFLIAALRGTPLPEVPLPTHSFEDTQLDVDLFGLALSRERVSLSTRDWHSDCAAFPAVTVEDAISDLPPFEYEDSERCPGDKSRAEFNPLPWEAGKPTGMAGDAPYGMQPANNYQRRMRRDCENGMLSTVTSSVVPACAKRIAQRFCAIGIAGEEGKEGNYRDIPPPLQPVVPPALALKSDKVRSLFWSRLGASDFVSTLRTTSNPDGTSHGPRIHYELRRPLSVREYARLMGVSDQYIPQGNGDSVENDFKVNNAFRVLGNGVPPPMACAIGREFTKAMPVDLTKIRQLATRYREEARAPDFWLQRSAPETVSPTPEVSALTEIPEVLIVEDSCDEEE